MILHSITRCVYLLEAEVRRGEVGPAQSAHSTAPGSSLRPVPLTGGSRGPVSETRGQGDRGALDTGFSCLFHLSSHTLGFHLYYGRCLLSG